MCWNLMSQWNGVDLFDAAQVPSKDIVVYSVLPNISNQKHQPLNKFNTTWVVINTVTFIAAYFEF